jgi:hypothetical protein
MNLKYSMSHVWTTAMSHLGTSNFFNDSISFGRQGIIPSRSISPRRLRYVSKSFKETPKNMLYSDYIQRTSRSVIWRKLNYHLIIGSFIMLALGPKHKAFFLLTVA